MEFILFFNNCIDSGSPIVNSLITVRFNQKQQHCADKAYLLTIDFLVRAVKATIQINNLHIKII